MKTFGLRRRIVNAVGATFFATTALTSPNPSNAFFFSFPNLLEFSPADTFMMLLVIDALIDPSVVQQKSKQDPFSRSPGAPFPLASSETNTTSAIYWAGQDISRVLNLRRDERFAIGVSYRQDWSRTHFFTATNPALGSQKSENNSLGFNWVYTLQNWHLGGVVGGRWGDGRYTEAGSPNVASFNSSGFFAAAELGYVVTLGGESANKVGNINWKRDVKQTSLYIDPTVRALYGRNVVGSFVDPANSLVGNQTERYVSIGGGLEVFALVPDKAVVYSPFVKVTVDQQISYSYEAVNVVRNVTEKFDHDRTFARIEGGLNAYIGRNVTTGVSGFYGGSGDREDYGVKGTLLFNFATSAR
jgi:hypothetical protein